MFLAFFSAEAVLAATGTISSSYKYAWGNSSGWINFKPTNGNVSITDNALTGYVWSEVYGWINLNPAGSGIKNTASGVLSGSAWGQNTGWINFSGVTINCSGRFVGTATGDVVGTIIFDCSNCNVTTDWRPSSGCGGGGGPPPPPPPPPPDSHNECNAQKQCVAVSGSGTSQCANGNDCSAPKHNECNAQKQCVAIDGEGDEQCQTDVDCALTHSECNNNEQCIFVSGFGLNQCATDVDCGPTYNICSSMQCVIAQGIGADQCQKNEDCVFEISPESPPVLPLEIPPVIPPENSPVIPPTTPPALPHGNTGIINTSVKAIENITQTVNKQIQQTIQASAETAKVVTKNIQKAIETKQGSLITKTVSTVGAVAATAEVAIAIVFSPMEIFLFIFRLSGILLTSLGLKRRIKPWGVVYDSVTKQPLDPAYVVLNDPQGKVISSAITDIDGRYGFLEPSGTYQISVNKTNYVFPSQKLAGKINDELYNDLYFGENIDIEQGGETITKNIPMDPLRFDWNEFAKRDKKLMNFYSRADIALRRIFDLFFIVGFVVAIIAYFAAPYPYNLIILTVYLILLLLRTIGVKPKAYGRIFSSANGNPVSFAILRIVMPDSNVEVAHKVADKYGRYYCLVPKGKYFIKIEKKNDDGSYSLVYTSSVIDASKKGIIKNTFRI